MHRQEVNNLKKYKVQCPYCGSIAVLKPAVKVFGANTNEAKRYLYVCARWPACDSYVAAHLKDLRPMGTLANRYLRHKRILAHKALNAYQKATHTDKWAAYIWLEGKLGMDQGSTHIGMFSVADCNKVIAMCRKEVRASRRAKNGGGVM